MKKNYLKPDAEYITFYSDKEITTKLDINTYANDDGDGGVIGGNTSAGDNPFPE